jgi:hypothetical protein
VQRVGWLAPQARNHWPMGRANDGGLRRYAPNTPYNLPLPLQHPRIPAITGGKQGIALQCQLFGDHGLGKRRRGRAYVSVIELEFVCTELY